MKRDALLIVLFAAAMAWAGAAGCSGSADSPANAAPSNEAGTGPEGDQDAGEASETSAPVPPESCDPYEPRQTSPELLIGPTGLAPKVIKLIDGAEKSIDLLIYELDWEPIIDALKAAKARGVTVRVAADRKKSAEAKATLRAAGIEVNDTSAVYPYMHAKVMIIDGARALVMSFNLNSYSMQSERNYGIVDHEVDDIADLQRIFDNDFEGGGGAVDLACSRLLVSPVNARSGLKEFFASAKTRLDLSVMYVTDREMVATLKERKAAGVNVRVLLADPSWIDSNAATAQDLAAAQIEVKLLKSVELHAKLVVNDNAAFVGSENFSTNALDQNREVGVFVTNAEPLAAIRKQFDADWAAGTKP